MDEFRDIQASLCPPRKGTNDGHDNRRRGNDAHNDRRRGNYANNDRQSYAPLMIADPMVPLTTIDIMVLAVIVTIMTPSPTIAFLYLIKHSMDAS